MKIAITAESTIDLPKELLEQFEIIVFPFQVTHGEKNFLDGELTTKELFDLVDKTNVLPKTSAHNAFEYTEFFESVLKDYDAIIHFALSSGITSSTKNAIDAASEMKNVYIVDSLSLSTGIALSAIYARQLTKTMDDPKKIADLAQERVKAVQASFVVERLDYLYKGGRCSGFQLLGSNILKIRPRIVLKDGKMLSDKKYRGEMPKVVKTYAEDIIKEFNNFDKTICFVTYSTATAEMVENVKAVLNSAGFENVFETQTGATVSSHCGANTLGVLYFNDGGTTL